MEQSYPPRLLWRLAHILICRSLSMITQEPSDSFEQLTGFTFRNENLFHGTLFIKDLRLDDESKTLEWPQNPPWRSRVEGRHEATNSLKYRPPNV
jgi:hypothetical protein